MHLNVFAENKLVRLSVMTPEQFVSNYREYLPLISKYLLRRVDRSEVEDLASKVFEIAWNKQDQALEGYVLQWLYRIAGFVVANHRRQLKNRTSVLALIQSDSSAPSAEEIAISDLALGEAWRKLSEPEKQVLALTSFEGLTTSEAAVVLEITNNALSIRLSRARTKLAKLLAETS